MLEGLKEGQMVGHLGGLKEDQMVGHLGGLKVDRAGGPLDLMVLEVPSARKLEALFQSHPWHQMHHLALSPKRLPLLVLALLPRRFSLSPWPSLTTPYLAA